MLWRREGKLLSYQHVAEPGSDLKPCSRSWCSDGDRGRRCSVEDLLGPEGRGVWFSGPGVKAVWASPGELDKAAAPSPGIRVLRLEGQGGEVLTITPGHSEVGGPVVSHWEVAVVLRIIRIVSSCGETSSLLTSLPPLFTWLVTLAAVCSLWARSNELTSCLFQLFLLHITVAARNQLICILKSVLTADLYVPDHPTKRKETPEQITVEK